MKLKRKLVNDNEKLCHLRNFINGIHEKILEVRTLGSLLFKNFGSIERRR